tara:strand:+ start:6309 stop:7523 length:1215 start_codon:yes stop_codon:yes gene_type:complete
MKKNLLFVGAYPPPYGGIASHLYTLLPELKQNGFNITSVTFSKSDRIIKTEGMTNIFVNKKRNFIRNMFSVILLFIKSLKLKNDLKLKELFIQCISANYLVKKIDRLKIDYIFLYDNREGYNIPIIRDTLKNKIIIIYTIYGDFYLYPEKYLKNKEYFDLIYHNSNLVLSSSEYCAKSANKLYGGNYNVEVIYTGVDENIYVPKSSKIVKSFLNIPESSFVFFFLGRMDKSMGIDFLLEVANDILGIADNVYLILAGARGEYSNQCSEISNEYLNIQYHENIPFEQKLDFYHASDVYLAPTMQKHACMGVSIKEAMACRLPIIASNSGGIPEAVKDGENGFIIKPVNGKLDKSKFINATVKLYKDKNLRKEMGNNGRSDFLEKFTNQTTTNHYLNVINQFSNSV